MAEQEENEELDLIILNLNQRGYHIDFNPSRSNSVAWGVSRPWPTELDFEIDEVIECRIHDCGNSQLVNVLAITTKQFQLKGIIIEYVHTERYWPLEEIGKRFYEILINILRSIFHRG